jgi:YHS domain-containing protein
VCGMEVDTANPPATAEHASETYYFCCPGCADAFTANPDEYVPDAQKA